MTTFSFDEATRSQKAQIGLSAQDKAFWHILARSDRVTGAKRQAVFLAKGKLGERNVHCSVIRRNFLISLLKRRSEAYHCGCQSIRASPFANNENRSFDYADNLAPRGFFKSLIRS
jgi:hypothetical protein